jgi:hypothetical protein
MGRCKLRNWILRVSCLGKRESVETCWQHKILFVQLRCYTEREHSCPSPLNERLYHIIYTAIS